MKLYLTPKTFKKIIFFLLGFITSSIIIYYSKFGLIDVNAATYGGTITWPESKYVLIPDNKQFTFRFQSDEDLESAQEKFEAYKTNYFYVTHKYTYNYDITKSGVYSVYNLIKNNRYTINQTTLNSCDEYPDDTYCIYEYDSFTSIDDDGIYTYTEFITIKHNRMRYSCNISYEYNLGNAYYDNYNIPGYARVDVVDFAFAETKSELQPKSIQEIVDSSEIDYFNPEDLPYQDISNDDDSFITKLVKDVLLGIKEFGITVWVKIKLLFEKLFVPSSAYFNAKYEEVKILFNQKFGVFVAPINIFIDFIERFSSLSSEDTNNFVINVPEYTIPGFNVPILKASTYNLSNVLNQGNINKLWTLYLDFVDCFLIISFLNLSWNKLTSFFGGMGTDNTYYSVDDVETYDKSTGELLSSRQRIRTTIQKRRRNY